MPPNLSRIVRTITAKSQPTPIPTPGDLLRGRAAGQRSAEEEALAAEGARALAHAVRPPETSPYAGADLLANSIQFRRQQGWS